MNRFIPLLRLVVVVVAWTSVVVGHAQPQEPKWSFGATFSPAYAYRHLNYTSSMRWVADLRDDREKPKFGYAWGGSVRYRAYRHFFAESGINFSNKGEKTKAQSLSWATADNTFPGTSQTVVSYLCVELPATIGYDVLEKKDLTVYVTGGVVLDVLISRLSKVVTSYGGQTDADVSKKAVGFTRLNPAWALGAGIMYRLSNTWRLSAHPFFQQSLLSITNAPGAKEYLFSFGIQTGVYYSRSQK